MLNAKKKKTIRISRVRSTPIYLWVKTTVDIRSSVSNSVMIGQAITMHGIGGL